MNILLLRIYIYNNILGIILYMLNSYRTARRLYDCIEEEHKTWKSDVEFKVKYGCIENENERV